MLFAKSGAKVLHFFELIHFAMIIFVIINFKKANFLSYIKFFLSLEYSNGDFIVYRFGGKENYLYLCSELAN